METVLLVGDFTLIYTPKEPTRHLEPSTAVLRFLQDALQQHWPRCLGLCNVPNLIFPSVFTPRML